MITTITGTNTLEMQQELKHLTSMFKKEHGELAIERIDGEEVDLNAILEAVSSVPFLAQFKLVIIRNLGKNKAAAENIEQIIDSISTSVNTIFYEPNPDKRTVFYKTLKAKTDFSELNELDARNLPKWLVDRAKDQRASLSTAHANYLVERVGDNQQMLASELDKLITFEPKITSQNINLLTEKTPQSKVFDLLDAAFAGHKDKALKLYEEQRSMRVEPQEILAMLAWQLRLMVYAKLAQGQTAEQIAKDIGASPYPLAKAQRLVGKIQLSKLQEMVAAAQSIDKKAKASSIDLDEALKTYIVSVL